LNNSICLLTQLDNDTHHVTINTIANPDNNMLDDDSLNELLLDLFDDILISTSINSVDVNNDAIENYKESDDRINITFRSIGINSIINFNTITNSYL